MSRPSCAGSRRGTRTPYNGRSAPRSTASPPRMPGPTSATVATIVPTNARFALAVRDRPARLAQDEEVAVEAREELACRVERGALRQPGVRLPGRYPSGAD